MSPDTKGDLGTVLGVWGHPDDEAYLSAGLMMRALANGHRVVCVTATRGEAGFPSDDARSVDERQAVRETELAACLDVLGVTEHRWLGHGDGRCAEVPDEEAVTALTEVMAEVRPDTVLTFGPDGGTGHPDHIAACRWSTLAFDRAALHGSRLLYSTKTREWADRTYVGVDRTTIMMVKGLEPEAVDPSELAVWLTCDDALLVRKVEALRAQVSQVEPLVRAIGEVAFTEFVREEFYRERRASTFALFQGPKHRITESENEKADLAS
jgi:LmbE family N-acetylglucosaminyl deacetylase